MGRETSAALKELFERAQTWSEATQAEAVSFLRALDEESSAEGDFLPLTAEDIEAAKRGLEDVRQGRVHTLDDIRAIFDRYRDR